MRSCYRDTHRVDVALERGGLLVAHCCGVSDALIVLEKGAEFWLFGLCEWFV